MSYLSVPSNDSAQERRGRKTWLSQTNGEGAPLLPRSQRKDPAVGRLHHLRTTVASGRTGAWEQLFPYQ